MAIAYESIATSLTGTCTKPTGTATGDLLVAAVCTYDSPTPPSGWTQQAQENYAATYFLTIYTKAAGGSEPSDYTWTSTAVFNVHITRISGADTTNPITGTPTSGTSLDPTCASITTGTNAILMYFPVGYLAATTPPTGMTERAENGPDTTLGQLYLATDTESVSSGATGSRATASTAVVTVMVAIAEGATSTDVTVSVPAVPDANAAVPAHTVSATTNVTVTAPLTDANAAVPTHIVSTGTNVDVTAPAPDANATAPTHAVTTTRNPTVVAPVTDANAAAPTHAVTAQQYVTVTAPAPDANASPRTHTVTATWSTTQTAPVTDANAAAPTHAVSTEQNITLTVPVTDANAAVPTVTVTSEQHPTIETPAADANAAVPTHIVTVPLYVTLDVPVIDANATAPLMVVRAERTVPAWAGGGISMDPRETTVTVSEPKRIRGTADNRRITGYSRDQGTVTGRQVEN